MSHSKERIVRNINKYRQLRSELNKINIFNINLHGYNDKICNNDIINQLYNLNNEGMWCFKIDKEKGIINIWTYFGEKKVNKPKKFFVNINFNIFQQNNRIEYIDKNNVYIYYKITNDIETEISQLELIKLNNNRFIRRKKDLFKYPLFVKHFDRNKLIKYISLIKILTEKNNKLNEKYYKKLSLNRQISSLEKLKILGYHDINLIDSMIKKIELEISIIDKSIDIFCDNEIPIFIDDIYKHEIDNQINILSFEISPYQSNEQSIFLLNTEIININTNRKLYNNKLRFHIDGEVLIEIFEELIIYKI